MKLTKLAVIIPLLMTPLASQADDSFQFGGYARNGGATNIDGQNAAKVNPNQLGRFGNEDDAYIDLQLSKKFTADNGMWAEYIVQFNRWDGDMDRGHGSDWNNEMNYVTIGGFDFLPEGGKIWAGQRKQEADFHILDYKWRRIMGTGIGYESNNFDFQFVQQDSDYDVSNNDYLAGNDTNGAAANSFISRVTLDKLQAELMYTTVPSYKNVIAASATRTYADKSVQLTVNYSFDSYFGLTEGSSKVIAQYGTGVNHNQLGWTGSLGRDNDDTAYRIAFDGVFSPSEGLDINPVLLHEGFDVDSYSDVETRTTLAVRAKQTMTKGLSVVGEVGFTSVQNHIKIDTAGDAYNAGDGIEYKIAAGPQFEFDSGYWARPVIRITAAYISVDKELQDKVFNDDGDDSEFRLGYEFEAWF